MIVRASIRICLGISIVTLCGCDRNSAPQAEAGDRPSAAAAKLIDKFDLPAEYRNTLDELRFLGARITTNAEGRAIDVFLSSTKQKPIEVTDDEMYFLKELDTLEVLQVADAPISDTGLEFLKDHKKLRTVVLARTKVTDAGVAHLSNNRMLQWFDLAGTQVTDDTLYTIKSSFPHLERLDLSGTKVTMRGVVLHLKSMSKLRRILFQPGQFPATSIREMRRELTGTTIY